MYSVLSHDGTQVLPASMLSTTPGLQVPIPNIYGLEMPNFSQVCDSNRTSSSSSSSSLAFTAVAAALPAGS
jgi:hypothetical protein